MKKKEKSPFPLLLSMFLLPWPASSPDMNPIEEIWRRMKMRIARRNHRATKAIELRQAIQEGWDSITPDEVRALVLYHERPYKLYSMPKTATPSFEIE